MRTSLTVNLLDVKGKKKGKISLPKEIFAAKVNESLMAQAVRVYLANQRQGTASTKTRGEVTGSRRKIWRQKGTGRARHGDRYAPIFVGGGVAHGPKPKNWSLQMNRKMKRKALLSALTSKFKDRAVTTVEGLEKIKPKTKEMVGVLERMILTGEGRQARKKRKTGKVLLVLPKRLENILRAGRNIPYLTLRQVSLLNTYEVLNHDKLIFMKEAIAVFKKRFKES